MKEKKSKQNKKCQIIQSRELKSRQNQRHTITTVSNVEELIFAETLHCDTGTLSITNKQPKAGPVHDALQISPKPWQQALRTIIFSVSCCFTDSFIAPVIAAVRCGSVCHVTAPFSHKSSSRRFTQRGGTIQAL